MATLEQKIDQKSLENVEKLRRKGRKSAATIFDNMVRIATKKRYSLSIKDNRVVGVLVPTFDLEINSNAKQYGSKFKAVMKKEWYTPYIYSNELFLKNDKGHIAGSLVFGNCVNRV